MEITKLSILEQINLYKAKKLSPVEVANEYIKKINKNKHLNAFVLDLHETAIEKAKEAEARYHAGDNLPLDGIFYGIKDLFCTKGIRTTAASAILRDFVPTYESTITKKLNESGAIGIGKTNLDEFAMGSATINSIFGPSFNPWGKNLTPGGSSGGSSSCVSSDLCAFAIASDTGGSVRQPAAYTGTVGIKPTYGRCSRFGMIAFASSLDQASVVGKNVDDAAYALQYMMGYDVNDSTSINKEVPNLYEALQKDNNQKFKIGIPRSLIAKIKNQDLKDKINESIKHMQNLGFEIRDIDLTKLEYGLTVYYIIAPAEASTNLARYDGVKFGHRAILSQDQRLEDLYRKTRGEGFGQEVKRRILIGTYVLSSSAIDAYYIKAQRVRSMILDEFKQIFKDIDAIFMPTAPSTAFDINNISSDPTELYLTDVFTIPASLAGMPAMSLPIGLSNNLPLGGQLICDHFCEEKMLIIAKKLEKEINFTAKPFENIF